MYRRWMPLALAVGTAGLAVLGAFLLGGFSEEAATATAAPKVTLPEDTGSGASWFPTDAVKHGTLLGLDDDGRALVAFNYSDDLRPDEPGSSSWDTVFGERPGVAIVGLSGEVTVLVEPAPIDPDSWVWIRGDINGEMVAWDYVVYPKESVDDSPQTIWVSRGGASPVAVQPRSADGTWVELEANPGFYVTDDYLVGATSSQGGGVAMVSIDSGSATILEPEIEGFLYSPWIHRDLCAEAAGGEAYTFAVMTDGPGDTLGDILQQWTLTLNLDGTHSLRQIPLVTEVERMGVPTTACGDNGANGLKLATGGAAVGYRTGGSYQVVQDGDHAGTGDVYLSPDYVVGVPVFMDGMSLTHDGVVVTEISTGATTTWGNGSPCTLTRLRGTYLSYPVNDESGSCRTAVVALALEAPSDLASTPTD